MARSKRTLCCYKNKWWMVEPTSYGFKHTELGSDRRLRDRVEDRG